MFKVGQKVVCKYPIDNLIKDEIYTISFIIADVGCRLFELNHEPNNEGYLLSRFRPLDDAWVDDLLNEIILEVESEEEIFV